MLDYYQIDSNLHNSTTPIVLKNNGLNSLLHTCMWNRFLGLSVTWKRRGCVLLTSLSFLAVTPLYAHMHTGCQKKEEHKKESTLWWAHIASQTLKIVLLLYIMPLLTTSMTRNRCVGIGVIGWHLVLALCASLSPSSSVLTDHEAFPDMATNNDE